MRFEPGQSGNPAGRPPGSRNKKTLAMEELLGERAEAAVTTILNRAEGGCPTAMRLCMERVLPTGANRPLTLEIPPVSTPDDVIAAAGVVIEACGHGAVSPRETVHLLTVVERLARIAERAQQMKERHAAWKDAPAGTDASLADFARAAARAALAAALQEEGADVPLYSPVNSGASARVEETPTPTAEESRPGAAADGEGLYFPVNSAASVRAADTPSRTAEDSQPGAATDRAGLYFPVNSGAVAPVEEPPPGAVVAAPPSAEGHSAAQASQGSRCGGGTKSARADSPYLVEPAGRLGLNESGGVPDCHRMSGPSGRPETLAA